MRVEFGSAATDYSTYSVGFPTSLLGRLQSFGIGRPGQIALDLGTGTGSLARLLAIAGCRAIGIDPVATQFDEARRLDAEAGVAVEYRTSAAENTGLPSDSVDCIIAGQAWHWFDRGRAASEAARLLKPGGHIAIAHFDWVPLPGNVVAAAEELIRKWNSAWPMGAGSGLYPQWLNDLALAGFSRIETFSYDVMVPYGHAEWRARIRASVGIAGSLSPQLVTDFDREHGRMLESRFSGDPLQVPHRVWAVVGRAP
jgi:SAM-dependent methyltransferase